MKNILFVATCALFVLNAFAGDLYKMKEKHIKATKTKGKIDIKYPHILPAASKHADAINKLIVLSFKDYGCDGKSSEWAADAAMGDINANYLSFEMNVSFMCEEAAHPDNYTDPHVYDVQSGKRVDLRQEFIFSNADIANLLVKKIPADLIGGENECFSKDEAANLESLKSVSYNLAIKNKQIVISTVPAHVMQACSFSVSFPLSSLSKLKPDSVLKKLLK